MTITGGIYSGDHGGGMHIAYSDPILENLTISQNSSISGGGIYLKFSNARLTHVTINENDASNFGGGISALIPLKLSGTVS